MNLLEYYRFENMILAHTNGGNIHKVKGLLGSLKVSIQAKATYPEQEADFNEVIADAQMRIHQIVMG